MPLPKKGAESSEPKVVKDAFMRASSFCAYQERTQQEVRERLREWDVKGDEAEEVISRLIEDNFINEERFAKAFAGGKFRIKRWGRIKIKQELRMRGLSEYCIKQGMREIEDADYRHTLYALIEKKNEALKGEELVVKKQKLIRYALSKGYENDLVWKVIDEVCS